MLLSLVSELVGLLGELCDFLERSFNMSTRVFFSTVTPVRSRSSLSHSFSIPAVKGDPDGDSHMFSSSSKLPTSINVSSLICTLTALMSSISISLFKRSPKCPPISVFSRPIFCRPFASSVIIRTLLVLYQCCFF